MALLLLLLLVCSCCCCYCWDMRVLTYAQLSRHLAAAVLARAGPRPVNLPTNTVLQGRDPAAARHQRQRRRRQQQQHNLHSPDRRCRLARSSSGGGRRKRTIGRRGGQQRSSGSSGGGCRDWGSTGVDGVGRRSGGSVSPTAVPSLPCVAEVYNGGATYPGEVRVYVFLCDLFLGVWHRTLAR